MLEFRPLELKDAEKLKHVLRNSTGENCQMSLNSFYGWGPEYNLEIAFVGDAIVTKGVYEGETSYCFPIGEDNDRKKILSELVKTEGISFYGLDINDVRLLENEYPDMFIFEETRDMEDYIYLTEDLSTLKGKKYHSKRNHIKFFEKNYNWTYESINKKNINDCIRMTEKWIEENEEKIQDGVDKELNVIKRAFDCFDILGYKGGLIRVSGEIIAWTLGERLSEDTFCVHFEKAFATYRGAYPIINREFAKNELKEYTFINREEDMGLDGLRKAKLSYHPVKLGILYDAAKR